MPVGPQDGPPGGGRDRGEGAHPVEVPRVDGLEHQVRVAVQRGRVVAGHVRLGPHAGGCSSKLSVVPSVTRTSQPATASANAQDRSGDARGTGCRR